MTAVVVVLRRVVRSKRDRGLNLGITTNGDQEVGHQTGLRIPLHHHTLLAESLQSAWVQIAVYDQHNT